MMNENTYTFPGMGYREVAFTQLGGFHLTTDKKTSGVVLKK
jgi:hypothetical protein